MTEVVINSCYGGFGLSPRAILSLVKKNAKCIEKTPICEYYGGGNKYIEKPCYNSDWKKRYEEDIVVNKIILDEKFFIFSWLKTLSDGEFIYNYNDDRGKNREDQDLINTVKDLGTEANGTCANLKIVEIPNDINYVIDEYDGFETIDEAHRSWN